MAVQEGWDPILNQAQDNETPEQKENRLQHVRDHVKVFGTEEGKRLLSYYKKFTVDTGTWQNGMSESFAIWRDGQNTIVREIIKTLEKSEEK